MNSISHTAVVDTIYGHALEQLGQYRGSLIQIYIYKTLLCMSISNELAVCYSHFTR
jgi:hypothetical protein